MRLAVISGLPGSDGQELKQYQVGGANTVGAFGNEPYRIVMRSPVKAQVVLSIDGRNVLTGRDAYRSDLDNCFVLQPGRPSMLRAWPETSDSGAQFVFTSAGNSVAAHTPGDLGSVGYISAAVYVEGYEPPEIELPVTRSTRSASGGLMSADLGVRDSGEQMRSMKSPVGTGAGRTVSQLIGTAPGLIQPMFTGIVQVRYLWWDDLVGALRAAGIPSSPQHPTGFVTTTLAELGDTPRLGDPATPDTEYQRLVPAA